MKEMSEKQLQKMIKSGTGKQKAYAQSLLSKNLPSNKNIEQGVYVLKLEEEKYYVGYSANMTKRIGQHFAGEGAEWTKKYPPLELKQKLVGGDESLEQIIANTLIATHGKENVRGGHYTNSKSEINPNFLKTRSMTLKNNVVAKNKTCLATTKAGSPCNSMPVKGSNYCKYHKW